MISTNNHILMGINANQRMSRQDAQVRLTGIARDEGRNEECEQLRRALWHTSGIYEIRTPGGDYKVNCQRAEERVLGGGWLSNFKDLVTSIMTMWSDDKATEKEKDGMKYVVENVFFTTLPPPIYSGKTEGEQKESVMPIEQAVLELGEKVEKLEEQDQNAFEKLTQSVTKALNSMKGLRADAEGLNDKVSDLKKEVEEETEVLTRLKAVRVDKKEGDGSPFRQEIANHIHTVYGNIINAKNVDMSGSTFNSSDYLKHENYGGDKVETKHISNVDKSLNQGTVNMSNTGSGQQANIVHGGMSQGESKRGAVSDRQAITADDVNNAIQQVSMALDEGEEKELAKKAIEQFIQARASHVDVSAFTDTIKGFKKTYSM